MRWIMGHNVDSKRRRHCARVLVFCLVGGLLIGLPMRQPVTFASGARAELHQATLPPPADGIELVSVSSHVVRPGEQFLPSVTIKITSGRVVGYPTGGDHLHAYPEGHENDLYAHVVQPITGTLRPGNVYTFDVQNNGGFRMIGPMAEGTYKSVWRMRVGGQHIGPLVEIPVTVSNNPGPTWTATGPPSSTPSPPSTPLRPTPTATRPPTLTPSPTPVPRVAVYVHGYAGFGQSDGTRCTARPTPYTGSAPIGIRRLADTLRGSGYRVYSAHYESTLDYTSDLKVAAECLDRQIKFLESTDGENVRKVTLIGYSMGGLVSRAYIDLFGTNDVETLITFGTPHTGVASRRLIPLVKLLRGHFSHDYCAEDPGLCALSTEKMREYNGKHPPDRRVRYYQVGGTHPLALSCFLLGGCTSLTPDFVRNDGVVYTDSSTGLSGPNVTSWLVDDSHFHLERDVLRGNTTWYGDSVNSDACLRQALGLPSGTGECRERSRGVRAFSGFQDQPLPWAMAPIREGTIMAFDEVRQPVVVDGAGVTFVLRHVGGALDLALVSPDGSRTTADTVADRFPGARFERVDTPNGGQITMLTIPSPQSGTWSLVMREMSGVPTTFVALATMESSIDLTLVLPQEPIRGSPLRMEARLSESGAGIAGASVYAEVAGRRISLAEERPGVYAADVGGLTGSLPVVVRASGATTAGSAFSREDNGIVVIPEPPDAVGSRSIFLPTLVRRRVPVFEKIGSLRYSGGAPGGSVVDATAIELSTVQTGSIAQTVAFAAFDEYSIGVFDVTVPEAAKTRGENDCVTPCRQLAVDPLGSRVAALESSERVGGGSIGGGVRMHEAQPERGGLFERSFVPESPGEDIVGLGIDWGRGSRVYGLLRVAVDRAMLRIIDAADLRLPQLIGSYEPHRSESNVTGAVLADEPFVYLSFGTGGLEVVDVSDPRRPATVAEFGGDGECRLSNVKAMAKSRDLLLLTDDRRLHALDVSTPSRPLGLGCFRLPLPPGDLRPRWAGDVASIGIYAFVVGRAGDSRDEGAGVWVVDFSVPTDMVDVAFLPAGRGVRTVQTYENLAFVSSSDGTTIYRMHP